MRELSSYPPGESGGRYNERRVRLRCSNNHEWSANVYDELGASNYDTDDDAFCARCGHEGIETGEESA